MSSNYLSITKRMFESSESSLFITIFLKPKIDYLKRDNYEN